MKRTMGRIEGLAAISLLLMGTAALSGCGSDGGAKVTPISGIVTQGPVSDAVVFADNLTGAKADLKKDADEIGANSGTTLTGAFTLPSTPGYAYRIVSQGGTDTLTGQPAMQMIAPSEAKNITPLTTLVALDTTGTVKTLIESLGVKFDANISEGVTPAALLLVKSVESTVAAMTNLLDSGLNTDQANIMQEIVVKKIATELQGKSAAQVTAAGTLTASLRSAVASAITEITTTSTLATVVNVSSTSSVAQVADSIVPDSVVQAIVTAIGDVTKTTGAVAETSLIDKNKSDSIKTAVDNAVDSTTTQVVVTPSPNQAPVFSQGTPQASVSVGEAYSFVPAATDADNNTLTFSIVNKPSWASFNPASGALTGTPSAAGTTSGIVISVTDGIAKVSMAPFSITVTAVSGGSGGSGGTGGAGGSGTALP